MKVELVLQMSALVYKEYVLGHFIKTLVLEVSVILECAFFGFVTILCVSVYIQLFPWS